MDPTPRLIVCDDNEQYGWAIKYNLRNDFDVSIVCNTDELMELLRNNSADVILLDIELRTDREGLDRLPEIKQAAPHAPIVMASGHTEFSNVREAFQQGVIDFLPKDASADEIRFTIKNALRTVRANMKSEPLHLSIEGFEREKICEALRQSSGNQTRAARLLGIDRTSLFRKMKKFRIESPNWS